MPNRKPTPAGMRGPRPAFGDRVASVKEGEAKAALFVSFSKPSASRRVRLNAGRGGWAEGSRGTGERGADVGPLC